MDGLTERAIAMEEEEKKKRDHRDRGGARQARQGGSEPAAEKKAGEQDAVCDNLVEETGLCGRPCQETENIFYWRDLGWIIQVKWSDLGWLSRSTCDNVVKHNS